MTLAVRPLDGVVEVVDTAVERRPHGAADRGPAREGRRGRRPDRGRDRRRRRSSSRTWSVREAGDLTVDAAINDRVADDLSSAERISLPITLVLMLLAFGALIAAGIPVLLAATSVAATIGISAPRVAPRPRRRHRDQHDRADRHGRRRRLLALLPQARARGARAGTHHAGRRRDRRARRPATRSSSRERPSSPPWPACSWSATPRSTRLAVGSILVVAIAVLGSITVLPALLVKLGRWVDRPRVPLLWRLNRRIGRGGISSRLLAPVLRHPVASVLVGGLVVAALAAPALGMKTHSSNLETLPDSIPQVQTMRRHRRAVPRGGTGRRGGRARVGRRPRRGGHGVSASSSRTRPRPGSSPTARRLWRCRRTAGRRSCGWRCRSRSPTTASTRRSDELRGDLTLVRAGRAGRGRRRRRRRRVSSTSSTASSDRLPLVIGFVLLLTLLMMASRSAACRSRWSRRCSTWRSVGVAFGVMTLVFQHGWGESGCSTSPAPGS